MLELILIDHRELAKIFPPEQGGNVKKRWETECVKHYPTETDIQSAFNIEIQRFKKTNLCKRMEGVVQKLLNQIKVDDIDNIVAFGLTTLSPGAPPAADLSIRLHAQHAALLIIREIIEKRNATKRQVPIYSQDPQYSQRDVAVAKTFGITIVNGDIGHQMGWLQVSPSSFVVELAACVPVFEFILEYTRPAAMLSAAWDLTAAYEDEPFSYTLEVKGKDLTIPGPGT